MEFDTTEVRHLQADLAAAPASVRAQTPGAVRGTLGDVRDTARILAPKDRGDLAAGIGVDLDPDGMGGGVGPTADYGDEMEYGAAPHTIRANPGGKLAFQGDGGEIVFVDEVHHPGNAPQPYMGPAFDRHEPDLEDALGDIGEGIL